VAPLLSWPPPFPPPPDPSSSEPCAAQSIGGQVRRQRIAGSLEGGRQVGAAFLLKSHRPLPLFGRQRGPVGRGDASPRTSATTVFIVEAFNLRSDLAIPLGKPDSLELYRDEFKQRLRGIREVIILCQPTSVDTIKSVDTVNRPIATRFTSASGQ
jgi:hypothetical protein